MNDMIDEEKFNKLMRRIEYLERKVAGEYPCPVCNGRTSASTKFPKRYCMQTFGHCGAWILPPVGRKGSQPVSSGYWPKTFFRRTTISLETGKVEPPLKEAIYTPIMIVYFAGGEEASREDYWQERSV